MSLSRSSNLRSQLKPGNEFLAKGLAQAEEGLAKRRQQEAERAARQQQQSAPADVGPTDELASKLNRQAEKAASAHAPVDFPETAATHKAHAPSDGPSDELQAKLQKQASKTVGGIARHSGGAAAVAAAAATTGGATK